MRRVDFLITAIRRLTENETVSSTNDISDDEFLQYINDGQDRLQSLLGATKNVSKIFTAEETVSLVQGQESYSIPDRVFMNKAIDLVEFSPTGLQTDYVIMRKVQPFNRDTNTTTYPDGYYRHSNKIYLVPIPSVSQGTLRIKYERTLDDLDKRRGTIQSVAGLTATTFTSLVVGSDADETSTPNLSSIDYICIVDKDGNRKAYNIPVGSYTAATNTLTPAAGFTFEKSTDTIVAGDYITFGKYTTTHSALPDNAERYLIHYAAEAIVHRDSGMGFAEQSMRLREIEEDIMKSMYQSSEIAYIPQFNEGEWW